MLRCDTRNPIRRPTKTILIFRLEVVPLELGISGFDKSSETNFKQDVKFLTYQTIFDYIAHRRRTLWLFCGTQLYQWDYLGD